MRKLVWEPDDGRLVIDGEQFYADGEVLEIPRAVLRDIRPCELPDGLKLSATRRVLGSSRDYYVDPSGRTLECRSGEMLVHVEGALSADEEDIPLETEREDYLELYAGALAQLLTRYQRDGALKEWKVGDVEDAELVYYSYVLVGPPTERSVLEVLDESGTQLEEEIGEIDAAVHLAAWLRRNASLTESAPREVVQRFVPQLSPIAGFEPGSVQLQLRGRTLVLDALLADARSTRRVGVEVSTKPVPDDRLREYLVAFQLTAIIGFGGGEIVVWTGDQTERASANSVTVNQARVILDLLSRIPERPVRLVTRKPLSKFAHLLARVESATENVEKGKSLEEFASALLGSLPGVTVKYRNLLTETTELDLVCEAETSRVPRCMAFSRRYFIAECKNWNQPAGAQVLATLIDNLRVFKLNFAILFSRTGVTGRGNSHAARTGESSGRIP